LAVREEDKTNLKKGGTMGRKWLLLLSLLLVPSFSAFAQEPQESKLPKEKIIAIATEAVQGEGYSLDEVDIIYDENNQRWEEQIGKMEISNMPNFGVFKKGFMQDYCTVYFDFKEPAPDLWVFIEKDRGEVLEVYKVQ
jgi:hypothetical protein